MEKQNYRKIEFATNESFIFKKNKIVTYKIIGYKNVYISNNCHIKPRALHIILKNVNEALKEFDAFDDRLKIIIVSFKDGINSLGVYDAIDNEMYLNEAISDKNKLVHECVGIGHIERHEVWHLKQALTFKNKHGLINGDNYENYIIYARSKAKTYLDYLGVNEDNVGVISKYAFSMLNYGKYDEVEAEIKAKKGAICILRDFQKRYKN